MHIKTLIVAVSCFMLLFMCCKQEDNTKKFELKGNPMIVDKFTADPAPMVYDGVL